MVTLTFTWSWWAFAVGAFSLLVLEFVILFWIAGRQYTKRKKQAKDGWGAMEQALNAWSKESGNNK
jgi:phosphotransferase system  glucose/maltose/N-acetylglucosamine-specific IIC component